MNEILFLKMLAKDKTAFAILSVLQKILGNIKDVS
jgi:hypothetical protein